MSKIPRPWQQAAIDKIQATDDREIALFFKPRLGKSLVIITAFKKLPTILFVAKTTLLDDFKAQLIEEGETDIEILRGSVSPKKRAAVLHRRPKWLLCTYSMAKTELKFPEIYGYTHGIIIDESHRIGDYSSQQSKWAIAQSKCFTHRAILSGTPMADSFMKLIPQFLFLKGQFMGETEGYRWIHKYAKFIERRYKWDLANGMTIKKIQEWINENSYPLNYEDVDLSGFELEYSVRSTPLTAKQKSMLHKFHVHAAVTKMDEVRKMGYLRAIGCGVDLLGDEEDLSRISDAIQYIEDMEVQAVVVSYHTQPVHRFHEIANKSYPVAKITGDTPIAERTQIIEDFNNGKYRALCSTIEPICEGISLKSAGMILFLSNDWKASSRDQMERRASYPGRPDPVLIVDYHTEGLGDETIHKAMRRKTDLADYILKGEKEWQTAP